jgi:hypothetical protein
MQYRTPHSVTHSPVQILDHYQLIYYLKKKKKKEEEEEEDFA